MGDDVLAAARSGGAWSLSALLFGMDHIKDDEGRPIAERRASSATKDGVPMELKPCPYHDARQGMPMNVSALEQITRMFKAVGADIEAFHRTYAQAGPTWFNMMAAVVDQLASPARLLLQDPSRQEVNIHVAVGYKLAAGYFDILRRLLHAEAQGLVAPASVDVFMAEIDSRKALIGASEVCAGPINMITKSSRAFLGEGEKEDERAEQSRIDVATALTTQIALGLVWEFFDHRVERDLICDPGFDEKFVPKNDFLRRKTDARRAELLAMANPTTLAQAQNAIPQILPEKTKADLKNALQAWPNTTGDFEKGKALVATLASALTHEDGALRIMGEQSKEELSKAFAAYLGLRSQILEAQWALENSIRKALAMPQEPALALNSFLLPYSRSLIWYEALWGHRLESPPPPSKSQELRNHHRRIALK